MPRIRRKWLVIAILTSLCGIYFTLTAFRLRTVEIWLITLGVWMGVGNMWRIAFGGGPSIRHMRAAALVLTFISLGLTPIYLFGDFIALLFLAIYWTATVLAWRQVLRWRSAQHKDQQP